jgi:hypothetical protein
LQWYWRASGRSGNGVETGSGVNSGVS